MVQPLWQPWPILWPSVVKRQQPGFVRDKVFSSYKSWEKFSPFWFCDEVIGKRGSVLTFWVSTGKLCVLVYDQPGEGWSGCHEEGLGAMSQRYITLPGLMALRRQESVWKQHQTKRCCLVTFSAEKQFDRKRWAGTGVVTSSVKLFPPNSKHSMSSGILMGSCVSVVWFRYNRCSNPHHVAWV